MAEKKFTVPEVLPVLPVRDTVLFPGAVLPLTVGRESSLALVSSLEGEEKLLAVVAQLDPRIEDPAAADLHKVGTLAKVHKTVKMPNGNVVVFLEGLQRVLVSELVTLRPFLRARVEAQPDEIGEVDAELEALQRNAQELFRDVVSHSPQLSDDLQSVALNIDDPGRLADFIAGTLPSLSTLVRQELIEMPNVRKRLEALIRELSKELEVLELRSKIHEQVQEQVSQNQREYLLREQMKAIQKELGESDDSSQEIDELRTKVEERLHVVAERDAIFEQQKAALDALIASSKYEVPEVIINDEIEREIRNLAISLGQQGIDFEQFVRYGGANLEQMREERRPAARERAAQELVLDALADQQGFNPSEEHVDSEANRVLADADDADRLRESDRLKAYVGERIRLHIREYTFQLRSTVALWFPRL